MVSAQLAKNVQVVLVRSAVTLDPDHKQQIESILKDQLKIELKFTYKTDDNLIAGLYIQVGDKVFNGSLRKIIDELLESIEQ